MDELLFTPAAVLDVLSNIEELKDIDVGVVEDGEGAVQILVGQSTYNIVPSNEVVIEVAEDELDAIDDASVETYNTLAESDRVEVGELQDVVEGGIIKELAKTLLVGGLVRLTNRIINKK